MKRLFLFFSLIFVVMAATMLATNFLPACNPGRGTGLDCDFSAGKLAKIDSPAKISIYSFQPFTFSYLNSGEWEEMTPLNRDGFYDLTFSTNGPIEIRMMKAHGGIDTPDISVYQSTPESYPSLKVTRTWNNPLLQLIQWYLFPVFLLDLFWFALCIYISPHV